jgi:hypothetical protein
MPNASAVVPRAFACSKYVRARVTREEALLEEKRKDGRESWKNFYLLLVLCTFYEGRLQGIKLQGQVKKFLILNVPSFLIRCCVEPLGQTTLFEHNISIEKRRREKKR